MAAGWYTAAMPTEPPTCLPRTGRAVGMALALAATACVGPPEVARSGDPIRGAQRVLAIDGSGSGLTDRGHNLAATSERLLAFGTTTRVTAWDRLIESPDRRLAGAEASAERILEFASRQRLTHGEDLAVHVSPTAIANRTTESLAGLPFVLGADRRPLPEITDQRHRTDPEDVAPEATLVERIRRRLRL
jgi:hypothetical protein